MVECTGLENRNTRKRIVGSNPTLSAIVNFLVAQPSTELGNPGYVAAIWQQLCTAASGFVGQAGDVGDTWPTSLC